MFNLLLISTLCLTIFVYIIVSDCRITGEELLEQQKEIVIRVDTGDPPNLDEPEKCDRYKCFNPLQCEISRSHQLLYYVYPPLTYLDKKDSLLYSSRSMFTLDYWQLISTILSSSRITTDPNKACFFIPSIDLSWIEDSEPTLLSLLYENLPYWRFVDGKPGTNHIVISLNPSQNLTSLLAAIGHSILASNRHDTWTFRQDFDLATGVIIKDLAREMTHDQNRPWTIALTQFSSLDKEQKGSLIQLKKLMRDDLAVLGYECSENIEGSLNNREKNGTTQRCSLDQQLKLKISEVLESARYCLIMQTRSGIAPTPIEDMAHHLLAQSLMFGCVPIVTTDLILPYHSLFNWSEIAILLTNNYNLESVVKSIQSISVSAHQQMSAKGRRVWLKLFQSYKQLANNLMLHYDSFVYPMVLSKSYCLHQRI